MTSHNIDKIMDRIFENTDTIPTPGIIIASPSNEPDYKYHWIRDSALVMRPIIDMYSKTKESKYFHYIINYIENESKIQGLKTLSGLGEPKININRTPFNGDWGRPQNDGPALRGIMLIKILDLFKYDYEIISNNVLVPMIIKDLEYILENYNKVSFDLWEENKGWHFYTRMVQLKFMKDCLQRTEYFNKYSIQPNYDKLLSDLNDHFNGDSIISSFNESGKIVKYEDAANILAFCHIDYDEDILNKINFNNVLHTCNGLLTFFRNKYSNDKLNMIGRYCDDKYYGGQIWLLCTMALGQVYMELYKHNNIVKDRSPMHRAKSNPSTEYFIIANEILEKVLTMDVSLMLPEQYNPNTEEFISAKKLTWNYSELYMLLQQLS